MREDEDMDIKTKDYIRRVVAEAPPLTPAQRDTLVGLLRGGQTGRLSEPVETPSQRAAREAREERRRKAKALKDYADSLMACAVCGIPEVAHHVQKGHGLGFHDWEPRDLPDTP